MTGMHPKKIHLFTPGPTPVPDAVLREMSAPIMHHRTAQWQEAFGEVLTGLKQVFGTQHDVATFASSGSGAMESAVANLVGPGDEVVVAEAAILPLLSAAQLSSSLILRRTLKPAFFAKMECSFGSSPPFATISPA